MSGPGLPIGDGAGAWHLPLPVLSWTQAVGPKPPCTPGRLLLASLNWSLKLTGFFHYPGHFALYPDSESCRGWSSDAGCRLPCDLQFSLPSKGFTSSSLTHPERMNWGPAAAGRGLERARALAQPSSLSLGAGSLSPFPSGEPSLRPHQPARLIRRPPGPVATRPRRGGGGQAGERAAVSPQRPGRALARSSLGVGVG